MEAAVSLFINSIKRGFGELCVLLNSARKSTVLTLLPLSDEALHCNYYQILKYPPKNQEKSCFLEADWTPF